MLTRRRKKEMNNTVIVKENPLLEDLTFKYFFTREETLKDFINEFFKYIGEESNFYFTRIIPQQLIMPNQKTMRMFYGDIVAVMSDERILSLEAYKNKFTKEEFNKSYAYSCRLFSSQPYKAYKEIKPVISINLIKGNYKRSNEEIVNSYKFQNSITHKIIDENNMTMYLIRYDMVEKIEEQEEESRFIKYLRILNQETTDKMKKIARGDKKMEDAINFVIKWNEDQSKKTFEEYLIENGWQQRWENAGKKIGLAEGKNIGLAEGKTIGLEEGKKSGLIEGKNTEKINIAKNLLNINIPENVIILATGLTKEELDDLKEY